MFADSFMNTTPYSLSSSDAGQMARLLQGMIDASPSFLAYCEAIWEEATDQPRQPTDFTYRLANKAVFQLFDLPSGQVLGQRLSVVDPVFYTSGLFDKFVEVIQSGQEQTVELPCWRGTEEHIFLVNATPIFDGLIVSLSDITNRRRSEQQAQQTLLILQRVLDAAPYTFAYCESVLDEEGHITDFLYRMVNRAVERILGLPLEQIVNQRMTDLFPGIQQNGLFDQYVNVVKTGQAQTFEWYLQLPSFSCWYLISIVPFNNGFVAAIIDISELKQLQQRLEATIIELKTSNENLQHFAYIASHDLQEPLRKIQAFSGLVIDEFSQQLGSDGEDILRRMQRAANRMQTRIRDLLDYSKMTQYQLPGQRVNLNDVTQGVLSDLELLINEKGARITVHPLPVLIGDSLQLQQLIQNLVSNALKFNRPDAAPVISIQSRDISIDALPLTIIPSPKQYVAIDVSDNGIGFEPQYQDRIFQLFQRLHNQSQYQGTGIGLAICKRVAENHGGAITATGLPGQGATFTVFLPRPE